MENIRSAMELKSREAAVADAFYVGPALVTAYRIEFAQFINMEEVIYKSLKDIAKRFKGKKRISDGDVSTVVAVNTRKKVNELKNILEEYEANVKEPTETSMKVEKALMETLKTSRAYMGIEGIKFDIDVENYDDIKKSIKVGCYTRGELQGKVEVEGASKIRAMLCGTYLLQKHEVVNVLLKARAEKDGAEFNAYVFKMSNGEGGILTFGNYNKPRIEDLSDRGISWDELECFR